MTSLRWYLEAHEEELPEDVREALKGNLTNDVLSDRVSSLSIPQLQQLCACILTAPRLYFGTFSGRELVECLESEWGVGKSPPG